MPTVDMQVFEDSKRHQATSKYEVYPLQSNVISGCQVQIDNLPSCVKEDIRFIDKDFLYHWVISKGSSWVKLQTLNNKTPNIIFGITGSPSTKIEDYRSSDIKNTMIVGDDFSKNRMYVNDANNPILPHGANAGDHDNLTIYSLRIIDDGSQYRGFYTGNKVGVGIDQTFTATAPYSDIINWTKYQSGGVNYPVLLIGAGGTWDDSNTYFGDAILDGSTWKMWYIGDDGSGSPHKMRVGYATSNDAITWNKSGSNPIYEDFSVNAGGLEMIAVIKVSDTQYYASVSHYLANQTDILSSSDGISWSKIATNVAPMRAWEFKLYNGIYYLFGSQHQDYNKVYCYTCGTPDGTYINRGVQVHAETTGWNTQSDTPRIHWIDNKWLMTYSGYDTGDSKNDIGYAYLDRSIAYNTIADIWDCLDVNVDINKVDLNDICTLWGFTSKTSRYSPGLLSVKSVDTARAIFEARLNCVYAGDISWCGLSNQHDLLGTPDVAANGFYTLGRYYRLSKNDGAETGDTTADNSYTIDTFYEFRNEWISGTQLQFFVDDVELGTKHTTNIANEAMKCWINADNTTTPTIKIDYMFARHFPDNTPMIIKHSELNRSALIKHLGSKL